MNFLLTGGAGYIGSHAALCLLDAGHNVHIIDNLSTGDEKLIPKDAKFTRCNIDDEENISSILNSNNFDVLMHFAGFIQVEESVKFPEKYFENNTENAIKLFKICKKNGLDKIVFSSTAAAYGLVRENKLIDESTNLNPQNPYAESKIKTEKFLFENKNNFKFVILRYFNVAGADKKLRSGQISKRSTHLIKILSEVAIGKRDHIEIYGNVYNTPDGTAIRDYIHVMDLADAHINAYKNNKKGYNVYNIGTGSGTTVLELVETFEKVNNVKIPYKFTDRREGDLPAVYCDNESAITNLNWTTKNTLVGIWKDSWNFILKNKN